MSIKELTDINWEVVTVDDLVEAHELKGICFEFNNGALTDIYSASEAEVFE